MSSRGNNHQSRRNTGRNGSDREFGRSVRRQNRNEEQPTGRSSSRVRHSSAEDEDERLARRLQDEYRQDFIRRQQQQQTVRPSAPPQEDDEVFARRLQREMEQGNAYGTPSAIPVRSSSTGRSNRSSRQYNIERVANTELPFHHRKEKLPHRGRPQAAWAPPPPRVGHGHSSTIWSNIIDDGDDEGDLRYAQQLQDEELARQIAHDEEKAARNNSTKPGLTATSQIRAKYAYTASRTTSMTDDTNSSNSNSSDRARRLAQELDDAEMAQRLALYEEEAETRRLREQQQQQRQQSGRSRMLFSRLLPLLCCGLAVALTLLFVLGVFDTGDISDLFRGDNWVDPFAGETPIGRGGIIDVPQDQVGWATQGRGLELEVLNAMEDRWSLQLATAVENWDQGFPIDSLTLNIRRVAYDPACSAVTGKLKVCNADYGETRWRGLNELMINQRNQIIHSSVAKLNEFYLRQDSEYQRMYTLCHEIGHGFGLPHWDEDFFNEDLGNCMDYTIRPKNNMFPDESNFIFLSQIYGGRNVTSGEIVTAAMARAAAVAAQDRNDESTFIAPVTNDNSSLSLQDGKKKEKEDDRRLLYPAMDSSSNQLTSRILISAEERHLTRHILMANNHFEVHRVLLPSTGFEDGDTFELYQYYVMPGKDE